MIALQKYLSEFGVEKLTSELGISANPSKKYPNLILFKYSQIDSPAAHPVVKECRGIILDSSNNWAIVSRPYDRFYNYGDVNASDINWESARIYEKLDGSLAVLYWYDNAWQMATSGSADASGPVNNDATMTFADLFWQTWNNLGYKLPTDTSCCYMFELMTPLNRVIVPHNDSKLVLHGIRSVEGNYVENAPELTAEALGWQCVKSYPLKTIDDVLNATKALNPVQQEGFIVCDNQFRRIKVKSPQYVALSHMKDGFGNRRMIELIRTNEGSEFLAYFPEYAPLYNGWKTKYDTLTVELTNAYDAIKHIPIQKDFALEAQKYNMPSCLFSLRSGKVKSVSEFLTNISITALEERLAKMK